MYKIHSILLLMQIFVIPLKVYVFSDEGYQISIRTDDPSDPTSESTSVAVSSEFYIQYSFKAAD